MGGSSSSIRATQFQRPPADSEEPAAPPADDAEESRINISNKMVERLVEDAVVTGELAAAMHKSSSPREDLKDTVYMERLKCMDERHSEKYGLTVEDMQATATRIELRSMSVGSAEPTCSESREKVIECYRQNLAPDDVIKCWDVVGAFSSCVSSAASSRLRARTERDARELARRSRHVAHARQHALRDLAPPTAAY